MYVVYKCVYIIIYIYCMYSICSVCIYIYINAILKYIVYSIWYMVYSIQYIQYIQKMCFVLDNALFCWIAVVRDISILTGSLLEQKHILVVLCWFSSPHWKKDIYKHLREWLGTALYIFIYIFTYIYMIYDIWLGMKWYNPMGCWEGINIYSTVWIYMYKPLPYE